MDGLSGGVAPVAALPAVSARTPARDAATPATVSVPAPAPPPPAKPADDRLTAHVAAVTDPAVVALQARAAMTTPAAPVMTREQQAALIALAVAKTG